MRYLPRLLLALCLSASTNAAVLENMGFVPKNNVDNHLQLALDLAAMRTARNNFTQKKDIYANGSGENAGGLTLQDLSLNSEALWGEYPMYNIYRAGYDLLGQAVEGDDEGFFDGKPIDRYADTLVNDLFLLNVTNIEAEAALAVNVYMAFYGALYDMLTACKDSDEAGAHLGLDTAAAYWIGEGQIRGDSATGYFFYNLAQFVGERFNQFADDGAEVVVNSNMISEFLLLQADIDDNKCSAPSGYKLMRQRVKTLVSYANQVLVQMLLHRVKTYPDGQPTDFVELYALAILPQIAACDTDLFNTILKYTVSLNVDDTTEQPLIDALQQAYSCLGITCAQVGAYMVNLIPECSEQGVVPMAGYQPVDDVRLVSRIDRDIRQIRWFMQFSAFEAAQEWYEYGWNSVFSLKDMARAQTVDDKVGSTYEVIADYFVDIDDRDFADDMVMNILDQAGRFGSATDEQLQNYLDSTLRGLIMFLGTTNELENAIKSAQLGDFDEAQRSWDQGAALYFGSTDGVHVGGAEAAPGESIYGLGNSFCREFNVCGANMIAVANEEIFFAFTSGATAISDSDASALEDAYNDNLLPNLIIPTMQGMLTNAIEAGVGSANNDEIALEYGYSRAVVGFFWSAGVQTGNIESASSANPGPDDTNAIFTSVTDILASNTVKTNCASVGNIRGSDDISRWVCQGNAPNTPAQPDDTPAPNLVPAPTPAPVPITRAPVQEKPVPQDHPSGLAWGRFTFNDNNLAELNGAVAQDVKHMWAATDLSVSENIYLNGENFLQGLYDLPSVTSLSKMSTEASTIMPDDTIYNFYRFALYESHIFDDPNEQDNTWSFANDVVDLALSPTNGNSPVLAAEAAVVINSFFIILRQLNEAVRQCDASNTNDALSFLDSAVAIWIGDEQDEGKFNSGYMMYSQAQLAWDYLRQSEQEAPSNTKLMSLFNDFQITLQDCSGDSIASSDRARMLTKDIAKYLTVPMVQQLLYYLGNSDKNFVEMFSVAFVPQIVGCSVGDYGYLRDKLFEASFFESNQDDQTQVIEDLAAGLACLGITCDDLGDASNAQVARLNTYFESVCQQLEVQFDPTYLAGYETDTPDTGLSKLDLDIHRIDILMQTKAIHTAKEIYMEGYSSLGADGTSLRTLRDVLLDASLSHGNGTLSSLYKDYFISDSYPHDFIMEVFSGSGEYESASRLQKAEAVRRMLQTAGMYLAIFAKIEKAQSTCESGEDAVKYVDEAAALFVGSIEGTRSGGSQTNSGTMLMALGKEVCGAFDKCESNGESTANEFILFAFSDMKQWLVTDDCPSAASIKDESLLPMLSVSIIQATLWFASQSEPLSAGSDDSKLAALDVFGKAILPQVEAVNATSAATLEDNTEFDSLAKAVSSGTTALFNAFTFVVRGMGVDCDVVGTLQSLSLSTCDSDIVAPHPDTPTTLGKNQSIYKSTTYVQNFADIALDVKEMEDNLALNDRKDIAEFIYKEGENSPVYDKYGIKIDVRSLSAFSTNATNTMTQNPLYQVAVFALRDESGNYLGQPATQYADSVVQEAFTKTGTLAAEGAVILNLWMETANELYVSLEDCKNQKVEDDQGIHQMDKVAAYWIGDGETAGNKDEGHLMYNLAERMAVKFGTVDESGQATVNLKFLRLLNQARLDLSFPQSCSEDLTTARKLQRTVTRIVAQMITVQVQGLINSILANDRDRVRIFAHGYVPLVKACSEHTFDFLNKRLIPADYSETEIDSIIGRIYSVLSCFEIECEDVGSHQETETGAVCEDPAFMAPLAGYRPSVDVADYSTLDLDINLMEILVKQQAYGVAKDVYMFGKHSAAGSDGSTSLSLQSLAKSTRRATIPDYNTYVQYYSADNNFADTMILNAFDSQDMEAYRREAVVVGTAQYIVMYMGIQEQMYESVRECKAEGRKAAADLLWNKAAAYIIGSIEGPVDQPYAQNQGVFLWGVAKKLCPIWGTCNNLFTGSTAVNDKIRELLYAGRGAVKAGSCQALEKAAGEITPLLRAPLIQASLTEILEIPRHGGDTRNVHHARAFVATESILPLIQNLDPNTAAMIKRNLDFNGAALNPDGAVAVAQGITTYMAAMGVGCEYVGSTNQVNTCTGEVSPEKSKRLPLVIGLGLGAIVGAAVAVLLFLWHSKKRNQTPEQPRFIRNQKGVMDEADQDYDPAGTLSRGGATLDDMDEADASNAAGDEFLDVELPEAV